MKIDSVRYIVARDDQSAAFSVIHGNYSASNRRLAWLEWLRGGDKDKKHWQKRGFKTYRVNVTAEVVG